MGTPFFVIGRSKTPLARSVSTLILPFFQIEICLLWSLFAVNSLQHNLKAVVRDTKTRCTTQRIRHAWRIAYT